MPHFRHWSRKQVLLLTVLTVLAWMLMNPALSSPEIQPVSKDTNKRIADQVFLGEAAFGGLQRSEAEAMLKRLNDEISKPAVDASIDPSTKGKIPGLNALALDIEKTLHALLNAQAGDRISPSYAQQAPDVTTADLPPAPIYRGNAEKKAVSILINVAWGDEFLPPMLDVLRERNVVGSFFLVGAWAEKNPEMVQTLLKEGHELHSHGYGTPHYERLGAAEIREQIVKADEVIEKLAGSPPLYFSPHRGVINETILREAQSFGHETIMWSLDTVDWNNPGRDWILNRIRRGMHPGALILMHPTRDGSAALPGIIDAVEQAGLRVLPISKLLSESRLDGV